MEGSTMRAWLWVQVAAVILAAGCAVRDEHRAYFHEDDKYPAAFSATHLGQDFDDTSVTDLLSPGEREALDATEWHKVGRDQGDDSDDGFARMGREPTTGDKVAGASMTLIGLGITVGAMVAPYLLF